MKKKTEVAISHLELIAIEKFANNLKINFPILLRPKDFTDRIMNIANEAALKRIDLAVERAKLEWDKEVLREARHYGKS